MTQCEKIIDYMKRFGSISAADAVNDLGCYRLAARISDIKSMGYGISKKMESRKNRYGETVSFAVYRLEEK